MSSKTPLHAYAAALLAAAFGLGVFFVTLLRFEIRGSASAFLAAAICAIQGAVLAFVWPSGSWRWGLWAASGFVLFFGLVFVAFLWRREAEWAPGVEAVCVGSVSCAGAWLGAQLSARLRDRVGER